jgi:hypothetical protein
VKEIPECFSMPEIWYGRRGDTHSLRISDRRTPSLQLGAPARSRGSTSALRLQKTLNADCHNRERASFPSPVRSGSTITIRPIAEQAIALRKRIWWVHNPIEIRSQCLNLGEASKVGNVLTMSTPRYPASGHFSHVGLLSAASGVIWSSGQT